MEEKELHETQPASVPLPNPDVPAAMPTKMHPMPSPATSPASTPAWIVVLLLIFFPPLAWYFMWKEAKYHRWFPILLWIYGLLSIILFSLIVFLIYPQLNKLYDSLEVERGNAWLLPYATYIAIALAVCEMLFGIFLYRKTHNKAALPKNLLVITTIILLFQWITVPVWAVVTQLSVITPIYMITSSFDEPTSTTNVISPTPDPTANWKKYMDKDKIFSIKLPPKWTIDLTGSSESANMSVPAVLLSGGDAKNGFFVQKYSKNITSEEFVNKYICNDNFGPCDYPEKTENITVSGQEAIKIYNHYRQNPSMNYVINNNGHFYVIGFNQDDNYNTDQQLQNQILSTFKFTK